VLRLLICGQTFATHGAHRADMGFVEEERSRTQSTSLKDTTFTDGIGASGTSLLEASHYL
jgi:hypothetical protein